MSIDQELQILFHKLPTYTLFSTHSFSHVGSQEIHTDILPFLHLVCVVSIQFIELIRQLDDHRPPTPTRARHPSHICTNPASFRPHHLTDRRWLRRPPIHPSERLQPFQKALSIPGHKRRPSRRRDRRCTRSGPSNLQNRLPRCRQVLRSSITSAQTGFLDGFTRGRGSPPSCRGA